MFDDVWRERKQHNVTVIMRYMFVEKQKFEVDGNRLTKCFRWFFFFAFFRRF